jgi:tetratricopeptide (TPR) repeat protein
VLLKNDCEKGEGVDLAKQYEVRVYPTFAMVDHDGEVTDRWAGYPGVEGFIEIVDRALSDRSTIAAKRDRFEDDPTLDLALSLAQYSEAVFASGDAVDYYRKAMALDPSLADELRAKVFMSMYYGTRQGQFTGPQLLAEGEAILASNAATTDQILMATSVLRNIAPPDEFVPFLKRALEVTADSEDEAARAFRKELLVDEALLVQKDTDEALRRMRAAMPEGWKDDPVALNEFAWWCFENGVNLDEAYELAVRGVELAQDDRSKANILDPAAQIAFARGEVEQAIAHQTRAVELVPDSASFQKTLERFEAARP